MWNEKIVQGGLEKTKLEEETRHHLTGSDCVEASGERP